MIVMSDDFKNSVSATEREMKGYVEVSFVSSADKSEFTIDNEPEILSINNVDIPDTGLLDDDRKGKNYASLEQDYFLLDGTFVLPNNDATKNPGMGYVSKYTFGQQQEEISEVNPFHFTTDATGCSGITVYFQNNVPTNLEIVVYSNGTSETFTDIDITDTGIASVTFSERDVTDLYIIVNDMLYTNRRLRLQEVDFGLSQIYEGEDLISFKTIEQCNRFGFELPINECDVVIGDYDNKFDNINPKGITQFLTDNVIIKPFVGVVTEDNGIEYCEQGWYWLDSWEKKDMEVSFKCKGFLNKLQQQTYQLSSDDLDEYLHRIAIPMTLWSSNNNGMPYNFALLKLGSGLEAIQKKQVYYSTPFVEYKDQSYQRNLIPEYKNNHQGIYLYNKLKKEIEKTINKENMKGYAEITAKAPIKQITLKEYQYKQGNNINNVIYETTLVCNGETDLVYDYGQPIPTMTFIIADNYTGLQILDARNHIYDKNNNLIYTPDYGGSLLEYSYAKINYTGTITFKIIQTQEYKQEISENVMNFNTNGEEISIDNEIINGSNSRKLSDYLGKYIKENMSEYSIRVRFNGDPTIMLGDSIEVENKYPDENGNIRYDKVWVTKIESEFKGSFNQTIEGDILEN